jgi:mannose-6-phosphate isomerase-like protein (cupin superfamily)
MVLQVVREHLSILVNSDSPLMNKKWLSALLAVSLISFAAGTVWERGQNTLESQIYRQSEVKESTGDWGSIHIYTHDETITYGTENMLTAELEFLPGKQLQPPHQHAEEEFSFIIEGSGTWSLNGEESEIHKGDLMYAKPWDWHGIRNSGTDTLRFFVVKWNSRGVPRAARAEN